MSAFRISEAELYEYNKGSLYRFNDHVSKLVVCSKVRKKGYEAEDGSRSYTPKGKAGNEEKLPRSVRRAKSKVFEYAMCNEFDFFCTLTFSPDKVQNRHDLEGCMKAFRKWLNNYSNRRANSPVRYLFIPEQHKDGAWHIHGLISGIPESDLHLFQMNEHLPDRILDRLSQGVNVYQWTAYDLKFGYCTLESIRSVDAVSKYITKYITKELDESIRELNAHMYYRSQGLKEKELVFSAPDVDISDPDYEGEYCKIKNGSTAEELLKYFSFCPPTAHGVLTG